MPEKTGQKHLVECNCVLPQLQNKKPVIFHCFVVFSELDEDSNVVEHYELCNNCSALHKIVDLCKSERVSSVLLEQGIAHVVEEEQLRKKLPAGLVGLLEANQADLPVWKETYYHFVNGNWGRDVIIKREDEGEEVSIKVLRMYDRKTFKLETYKHQSMVERNPR